MIFLPVKILSSLIPSVEINTILKPNQALSISSNIFIFSFHFKGLFQPTQYFKPSPEAEESIPHIYSKYIKA
jgi:hypothetical protein